LNRLASVVIFSALIATPFAARAQTMGTAFAVTPGPRGFDWLVGTWSCVNKNPSPLSGPPTSSFTATRAGAGTYFVKAMGANFQTAGYVTYLPKTKTWNAPAAFADGGYEIESSKDAGKKFTFTGTYYTARGKATTVRDLYTLVGTKTQIDVGQANTSGLWKTIYTVDCTRS
jgi:hypothetical protein